VTGAYTSVSIAVSTFVDKILSLGSNQGVIQQVFKFVTFILSDRVIPQYP